MQNDRGRVFYFFLIAVLMFFLFKLTDLQLVRYREYDGLAEENASRVVRLRAPRGIIYDRQGRVMVQNRPVFSLFFFPEQLNQSEQERVLRRLASKLDLSVDEIKARISNSSSLSYEGKMVAASLSSRQVARLKEAAAELPATRVVYYPERQYPYKDQGIHVLGHVGEISREELKRLEKYGYHLGDLIGKDGVELEYDRFLRGVVGGEKTEVDNFGRPTRLVESLDPQPGDNIKLTIDQEMQKAADEIFGRWNGAVVVLNPNNGEILAMVSHPSYDPTKKWEEISQANHPFMNRAISPVPSGSIFKPVVLQAAIDGKKFSEEELINCIGFRKVGTRIARCWKPGGHGRISFIEGLVWSCDVAFYELGSRLGIDKISEYARQFGLGEKTGIDLPREKKGLVPSREWKRQVYKQQWYEGDTINYAIGQGSLLVTPLQIASLYGQIATGKRFKPYIVKEIVNTDGKVIFSAGAHLISERPISDEIRSALREAVRRGTGVAANVPGFPAAGKTGTAENPGRPHAWFVSYAPFDIPEIVISVFIEHGEHGDRVPARIAGEILRWYKKFRFKRDIPAEKPTVQYILHGSYKQFYYPRVTPPSVPTEESAGEDSPGPDT